MPDQPCRSCGAPLLWTITTKGKRMPVDPEPSPEGNIVLTPGLAGVPPLAEVVGRGPGAGVEGPFYTSHFATCPHAAQHRRSRGRREPTTED